MNRDEIIARLATLEREQRHAEAMMIAAAIQSGDKATLDAALDEAVAANGLKVPVEMHQTYLEIMGVVAHLVEKQIKPDATLINQLLAEDFEARESPADAARLIDAYSQVVAHLCRADGGDPVHHGRRIAAAATERLHLGQRVWPEALYRWFDWDDRLLYVGITRSLATRQESHSVKSSWSRFAARCAVERAPDRASVELMEYHAIKGEKPLFNHTHNDTPEARQRLIQYLAEQGHLDLLAPVLSRG